MDIRFILEENETVATPIKIAESLISDSDLSSIELEELGVYLCTFARFGRISNAKN